tara:strand:- start:1376 stop:1693 length:318 start_codon:yes stop_codon:yes gene_type:complete
MSDFNKILEKAKEIEIKVKESQKKIKNIKAEGSSGGGVIKIILNGDGEIENLQISDSLLKEDKSMLEDLIIAAHNDAKNNLKTKTSDELSKVTGGFGLPGFKWPL